MKTYSRYTSLVLAAFVFFLSYAEASRVLASGDVVDYVKQRTAVTQNKLNGLDSDLEKTMVAANFCAEMVRLNTALAKAGQDQHVKAGGVLTYALNTLEAADISLVTKAEVSEEMAYLLAHDRAYAQRCSLRALQHYEKLVQAARMYGRAPEKVVMFGTRLADLYRRTGQQNHADRLYRATAEALFEQRGCLLRMNMEILDDMINVLSKVTGSRCSTSPVSDWARFIYVKGDVAKGKAVLEFSYLHNPSTFEIGDYLLLSYMHRLEGDRAGAQFYLNLLDRHYSADDFFYQKRSSFMTALTHYVTYGYLKQLLSSPHQASAKQILVPHWTELFEKLLVPCLTYGTKIHTVFGQIDSGAFESAEATYRAIAQADQQRQSDQAVLTILDDLIHEINLPLKNSHQDVYDILDDILAREL